VTSPSKHWQEIPASPAHVRGSIPLLEEYAFLTSDGIASGPGGLNCTQLGDIRSVTRVDLITQLIGDDTYDVKMSVPASRDDCGQNHLRVEHTEMGGSTYLCR
jgi:hypothetical protein